MTEFPISVVVSVKLIDWLIDLSILVKMEKGYFVCNAMIHSFNLDLQARQWFQDAEEMNSNKMVAYLIITNQWIRTNEQPKKLANLH